MTAPENTRERVAEALESQHAHVSARGAFDWSCGTCVAVRADARVLADALMPLIDTLLREQREGIAAAIEVSAPSPGDAYNREALHHTRAALLAAARIARTFGGER